MHELDNECRDLSAALIVTLRALARGVNDRSPVAVILNGDLNNADANDVGTDSSLTLDSISNHDIWLGYNGPCGRKSRLILPDPTAIGVRLSHASLRL